MPSGYSKKSAHSILPTGLPIQAIASKIGCNPETLRAWYRKHQDAQNPAAVAQQAQDARIKALEREIYELKRSNEILRKAAAFFARAEPGRKPK